MTLNDFWEIDEDGDGLHAFGMIDPVFDASDYQVAPNADDVFGEPAVVTPVIIGNSRDTFEAVTPREDTYKKLLQSISITDMNNYRRVLKAQMRIYQSA